MEAFQPYYKQVAIAGAVVVGYDYFADFPPVDARGSAVRLNHLMRLPWNYDDREARLSCKDRKRIYEVVEELVGSVGLQGA